MTKALTRCVVAAILAQSGATLGYDQQVTHPTLSQAAAHQSALAKDPALLARLGLKPFSFDERFGFLTMTGWLVTGVRDEDDGKRALNHFYDPYNDRPLTVLLLVHPGEKSPDWALEDKGDFAAQNFSFHDARDLYYKALTFNDPANTQALNSAVRNGFWAQTFYTLGHTIHHIQDMAQPQHVRNDQHCDLGLGDCGVIFFNPSRYEKYTKSEADQRVRDLAENGPGNGAVFPQFTEFKTARDFWKNSLGTGIAEFTNNNFVSQGANFKIGFFGGISAGTYPSPTPGTPVDYTIDELFQAQGFLVPADIRTICSDIGVACKMSMYPTTLTPKASTLSIFDQDLQAAGLSVTYADGFGPATYIVKRLFALNRFNFDAVYDTLVPMAVSYSAGLINFFFRGELEISLPDEKVYGVVDHAATHQADPVGGFAGFGTIKLKVRNTTPGGEAMTAGSLLAIARFHRNGCYKDDLSGEFDENLTPACGNFRTNLEEVVVSNTFPNVTLDATTPTPFTFTFPRAIPINATDLHIQVVYRGKLGDEADAIAAGDKDVFEPTYLAIFNTTDQILFNGVFKDTTDPTLLPALDQNGDGVLDAQFDRTNLDVFFGFTDGFTATPLATVSQLPPARYSRVALITDRSPYPAPIEALSRNFFTASVFGFTPATNQLDLQSNAYFVSAYSKLRGIPVWDSLTIYRFVGAVSDGDLNTLPALANKHPVPLTSLTFAPPPAP
jgi:hypothetical protein